MGVLWRANDQISITGSISERQFTTLRDEFGFRQTKLTLRYTFQNYLLKNTNLWHKLPTKTRQIFSESYVESNRASMAAALTNLLLHFKSQVIQLHEMVDLDRELTHDLKAIQLVNQMIKQTTDH